jgi:hypothetical protein
MDIEEIDNRFYMTEYGVPTVQLGNGDVLICDVKFNNEDISGVSFGLTSGEVGEDHPEFKGKTAVADESFFLQIISTNPKSFDVLIDKLQKAKADLEEKLSKS